MDAGALTQVGSVVGYTFAFLAAILGIVCLGISWRIKPYDLIKPDSAARMGKLAFIVIGFAMLFIAGLLVVLARFIT